MKKAAMIVGDRVWTMTIIHNPNGTVTIEDFNNEDGDGYMFYDQLDKLQSIQEEGDRVVQSVTINGTVFDVQNKQNVYTYRQAL